MPRKRRSYPAELKAKVAVEALREEATMAELAARYDAFGQQAPAANFFGGMNPMRREEVHTIVSNVVSAGSVALDHARRPIRRRQWRIDAESRRRRLDHHRDHETKQEALWRNRSRQTAKR